MSQILITGGTGIVGSEICKTFVKEGYDVVLLVREDSNLGLIEPVIDRLKLHRGDLMDTEFIKKIITPQTLIIHAAAVVSFSKKERRSMYHINVDGTEQLVNIALENGAPYFIFVSSIATIGRPRNQEILTEADAFQPSERNTHYALSKYLAEMQVWRGFQEGLKGFILNPSLVLGPSLQNRSSFRLFTYAAQGKPFYPPGFINFIDARDIARACLRLYRKQVHNERYIVSAGNASYKEVLGMIAREFDKKPPYLRLRKAMIWLAAIADGLASWLTGKNRHINPEMARINTTRYIFDSAKLKQETEMEFVSLSDSIKRITEWMKSR